MKQKLETRVAAAVGGIVTGLSEITLEEVLAALPAHITAANPSMKAITKGLVAAGWIGRARAGGGVVYMPEGSELPAPANHNACEGGSVAVEELRLLIERAERLVEDRKGITDDIKDVMIEAKSRGYDAGAIRTVMKMRGEKREDHQAKQAVLEVYLNSLGMLA